MNFYLLMGLIVKISLKKKGFFFDKGAMSDVM